MTAVTGRWGSPWRALGLFWEKRSHLSEGRLWLEQTLAACPRAEPGVRAAALTYLGVLAYAQGDMARAQEGYLESLTLRRGLGVPRGIVQSLTSVGNSACPSVFFPCTGTSPRIKPPT